MEKKLFLTSQSDEVIANPHVHLASSGQDYQFSIDKSTGNLLIIQDHSASGRRLQRDCNVDVSAIECKRDGALGNDQSSSLSREELEFFQGLDDDDSQCVLDTGTEQITFHSVEEEQVHFNLQAVVDSDHSQVKKRDLWTSQEVTDLLQCIQSNECKIRKSTTIKGYVWNSIAKEMKDLGHGNHNRDECAKKWANLYRTWKNVRLRGKDARKRWQYYNQVSAVVKSISRRGRTKQEPVIGKPRLRMMDLLTAMTEQNQRFQKLISESEESFQERANSLDKERDQYINEIKGLLKLS